MKSKFSICVFLAFFSALGINSIEAQTKETKKVVIKKKIIDKNGKETIEVKELEGEDADVFILKEKGNPGEEIEIEIDAEGSSVNTESKKVKIISIGEDGEKDVMEWEGEGDIPDDIKAILKEHNIDLDELNEKGGNEVKRKTKMKFIGEDGKEEIFEWEGEGEMPKEAKMMLKEKDVDVDIQNLSEVSSFKIKVMDENGEMKEFDWNGEGEMPEEMKAIMDKHELEAMGKKDHKIVKIVTKDVEGGNNNKAQFGIMISPAENGVTVSDFVEGSPAQESGLKKGDLITKVNGKVTQTIEALIASISDKSAGDKVSVEYIRDGVTNTLDVVLAAREKTTQNIYQWKTVDDQ